MGRRELEASQARKDAVTVIRFRRRPLSSLARTLSLYVGEPTERIDVPTGGLLRVDSGMALQSANHGAEDLLVYAYGYPPENEPAE